MPRVLACPDKFRGTARAPEIAAAVAAAVQALGWECDQAPLSDGGEGLVDAMGGANRTTRVRGPLGGRVAAPWHLDHRRAVVEMASASGLAIAGGPERNDPVAATTAGTGDLIKSALEAGARRVVIGLGGSATTDGGLGCIDALRPHARLKGVQLLAACDVRTTFVDAAERFAPQKGATPAHVELLRRRLELLAQDYEEEFGRDVRDISGSGAAGGLGGGLAALGAELVPGFDLVADLLDLDLRIDRADLVITGEGFLDDASFDGKVVGGVLEMSRAAGKHALVVVGDVVDPDATLRAEAEGATVVSLVGAFGRDAALSDALGCVSRAVRHHVGTLLL